MQYLVYCIFVDDYVVVSKPQMNKHLSPMNYSIPENRCTSPRTTRHGTKIRRLIIAPFWISKPICFFYLARPISIMYKLRRLQKHREHLYLFSVARTVLFALGRGAALCRVWPVSLYYTLVNRGHSINIYNLDGSSCSVSGSPPRSHSHYIMWLLSRDAFNNHTRYIHYTSQLNSIEWPSFL